jgi:hypothetical protein
MISVKVTGSWDRIARYLEGIKQKKYLRIMEKYGKKGVDALMKATPKDSGLTAQSWSYKIMQDANGATIEFHNDNINNHVNIAMILNYGHGTGTGGWVEGRDYINPAIQPVFDDMVEKLWKEVKSV